MSSTPVSASVSTGSAKWQATASAAENAALAAYLDRIAVTPPLREMARLGVAGMHLAPGMHALDVGCGSGVFLPLLAAAVGPTGRVTGIDHDPRFVATAGERVAAAGLAAVATVQEADAYSLPFGDATFDAAHCERVLIHCDDPTAVLREMRRVVKPGGWVVAVETNWSSLQIDHPDHALAATLLDGFVARMRQPRLGLELNRLMAAAGLVDRELTPTIIYTTSWGTFGMYGVRLDETADDLIAAGRLTRKRYHAFMETLHRADASGEFAGSGYLLTGAGRVPASPNA